MIATRDHLRDAQSTQRWDRVASRNTGASDARFVVSLVAVGVKSGKHASIATVLPHDGRHLCALRVFLRLRRALDAWLALSRRVAHLETCIRSRLVSRLCRQRRRTDSSLRLKTNYLSNLEYLVVPVSWLLQSSRETNGSTDCCRQSETTGRRCCFLATTIVGRDRRINLRR